MMKRLYLLLLPLILLGCTEKTNNSITYTGVVVEQNSLNPIPDLLVSITDGTQKYAETITDRTGQFSIEIPNNGNWGNSYIFIDGNGEYPSKKVDLIHTVDDRYDYGMIYLYNQTDASLYPKIENVDWDFPEGDHSMRFKDIVITTDYSLTEAYVEIAHNDSFTQSEKYQLEKQVNGKYSVVVGHLTVGEQYYFWVVASNNAGTGRSEVYSQIFGLPVPSIIALLHATVNSATIQMSVSDDPLTTLSAGLCWATSPNPTVNNGTVSGGVAGTSDVTIPGLDFRTTTYYVRAYAQNSNGIAYSEELVLPVNNPYSLPTFTSGGNTYAYKYLGYGSWYDAHDACTSLVDVFDDWTLPPFYILPDFFNTYSAENGEPLPLPVWSMRRYDYLEEGEPETFMLTNNGEILVSKNLLANYYAVRMF